MRTVDTLAAIGAMTIAFVVAKTAIVIYKLASKPKPKGA